MVILPSSGRPIFFFFAMPFLYTAFSRQRKVVYSRKYRSILYKEVRYSSGMIRKTASIIAVLGLALLASAPAFGQTVTTITALPFGITKPGTYILAADLTTNPGSSGGAGAISIDLSRFLPPGNVVLDLNGHTISGNGAPAGMTVSLRDLGYNTTIMNGTFDGFIYGIETAASGNNSRFLVDNITFKSTNFNSIAIDLSKTNRAVISRCKFVGVMRVGVLDQYSALGNTYSNLNFDGKQSVNIQEGGTDGSPWPYPQTVNFNSTQPQP
jgi:hypothetical protein